MGKANGRSEVEKSALDLEHELPASDVLSHRQIDAWLENAMKPKHLSDSDMGLEQENLPLAPATENPVLTEPKPA